MLLIFYTCQRFCYNISVKCSLNPACGPVGILAPAGAGYRHTDGNAPVEWFFGDWSDAAMPSVFLMNKDKPVALYDETPVFGKPSYSLLKQYDRYLPYGFESMDAWLEHRPAAKHRKHIADIMKQCNCDNVKGYIEVTHATSLTDTFWVKDAASDLSWRDVSLYRNEFNEMVARTAFDGNGLYGIEFSPDKVSPELATDGTYDKCWCRIDGGICLMKSGSEGFANAGMEPYSEKLASDFLDYMDVDHVHYDLCRFHGKLVSRCPLFTDEGTGYVPFSAYMREKKSDNSLQDLLRHVEETGISESFFTMLALDSFLVNTDRHTGNFGFLVDNDTGVVRGMAPLFDHNLALMPRVMRGDDWRMDLYRNSTTAFGTDFIDTAKEAMDRYPGIRSRLIAAKSFCFDDPGFGFPQWRLDMLNEVLSLQIGRVLDQGQKLVDAAKRQRRRAAGEDVLYGHVSPMEGDIVPGAVNDMPFGEKQCPVP